MLPLAGRDLPAQRDAQMFDLLPIGLTQAECAGEEDVLRLAVGDTLPARVANGWEAHRFPLGVDHLPAEAIHRDRIRGEAEGLLLPDMATVTAGGSALVDGFQ